MRSARLLGLADLTYGHRALEIGTGTGWNTALLAHRLGDDSVDSVEIDPRVADSARQALTAEGRSPRITVSDGYAGHPEGAPYDRITSTCGVRALPPAWLEQVAEDGVIVCPWGALEGAGVLARFECPGDGTARGTFHGGVGFVPLRVPGPQLPPVHDSGQQPDEYRLTQEDPIAPLMSFPSAFALSVMVPDWRVRRRWRPRRRRRARTGRRVGCAAATAGRRRTRQVPPRRRRPARCGVAAGPRRCLRGSG